MATVNSKLVVPSMELHISYKLRCHPVCYKLVVSFIECKGTTLDFFLLLLHSDMYMVTNTTGILHLASI